MSDKTSDTTKSEQDFCKWIATLSTATVAALPLIDPEPIEWIAQYAYGWIAFFYIVVILLCMLIYSLTLEEQGVIDISVIPRKKKSLMYLLLQLCFVLLLWTAGSFLMIRA